MASSHPTTPENSKSRGSKPPSSSKSRKFMNITVYFLDNSSHVFQLQAKTLGQILFDKVCKFINLFEVDYFGLEYEDEKGTKCWLDVLKPLCNQISTLFPTMYFCVKFYTPDPVQLEDEFTRYLFGLQLKKDLASGLLQCNDNTAAVIISYIVQAEIGDFNPEKFTDSSYLSSYKFIPHQEGVMEQKIMENHKKLIGQTPAEADMNLLETARRCELYGIKMTPAKDPAGLPLNLAIAHLGVLVFQNFTKINTFSWAKIRKLSFKRKKFLIKLHPEGIGYYKDTVEYYFDGRNECKNFWKKCIENHTFFRCTDAKHGMRQKPKIFSRGSSFRYSGRTQKQVSEYVRESCLKRPPFQRSTSLRTPSSPSRSIGSPITPQPLLPITSFSCGSMSDMPKEVSPPKTLSTSEPTTPHVAQDISRSINGICAKTKETPEPGLLSPDCETDQEGFQSPDFLGQDIEDNISHDSYDVLEKEDKKTNLECMLTNSGDSVNNKCSEGLTALLTNGTKEDKGKYNESFARKNPLLSSNKDLDREEVGEEEEDDDCKNKSQRHRVRVYSNHACVGQTSPTLYARANCHLSIDGAESSCKAYPRTVDFVLVNQLPPIGSFSYKDDSVELKSPNKIKLEMLEQSLKSGKPNVCNNVPKSRPHPTGVDLLSDLVPVKPPKSNEIADLSRKESALRVITDNLSMTWPSTSRVSAAADVVPSNQPHPQMHITIAEMHSNTSDTPTDISKELAYQNFYQMVYMDMCHAEDVVDYSSHYSYNNSYKFSQIGRPSRASASSPSHHYRRHSESDSHLG